VKIISTIKKSKQTAVCLLSRELMEKQPTKKELSRISSEFERLYKPLQGSSIFEILGIFGKELPLSNYLAHLFDEDRTHGLGRMFFEILLEFVIERLPSKQELINGMLKDKYSVLREKKNIDILLTEAENKWAIILENKVNHHLNNDFERYIQSTGIEEYIVIVLSLHPHSRPQNVPADRFCFITYRDLITRVDIRDKVSEITIDDETENYLYNEWATYMKNLCEMKNIKKEEIPFLKYYQENITQVNTILRAAEKTELIIKDSVNDVIKQLFNFTVDERGSLREGFYFYAVNQFYADNLDYSDELRLKIDFKNFFEKQSVNISLELNYNKVHLYTKKLADLLKSMDTSRLIKIDYKTKSYFACLVKTEITFKTIETFKEELLSAINERFVESGIFKVAVEKVIEQSKSKVK
jgi:hypothetical protein